MRATVAHTAHWFAAVAGMLGWWLLGHSYSLFGECTWLVCRQFRVGVIANRWKSMCANRWKSMCAV